MNKQSYLNRAMVAVGLSFLTLTFQSLALRAGHRMDWELAATIVIVASVASLLSGLIAAALVRNRPLLMLVTSQLLGTALIAFVARL